MSIWTHVAGVIRVDSFNSGKTKEDFVPIIGKEIFFKSSLELWNEFVVNPEDFVPTGSEGSLQYEVWTNPKKNCIAANTITIFGDLRDYSDTEKIEAWFKHILYDSGLIIRDAVMSIDCEVKEKIVIHYCEEEENYE